MANDDQINFKRLLLLSTLLLSGRLWAELPPAEQAARALHVQSMIALESVVVANDNGQAQVLPNVGVRVTGASGQANFGSGQTDRNGYFIVGGLARENVMLEIRHPGYRPKFVYVHLAKPRAVDRVTVDPIVLDPIAADEVRFVFGGDSAWVRRFYDTDLDGKTKLFEVPPSDPEAIIDSANPLPGTVTTTQYVKPYFEAADFSSINLETPVLVTTPFTPHLEKDFAFFSLPESLQVLPQIGIDYVALGNNHLWDYLEQGVTDTRLALPDWAPGVSFSGAGSNEAEAIEPHRFTLKGHDYSMLSGTSITGSFNEFSDDSFLYVARDSLNKGGAADLTRSAFYDAIGVEVAGNRIPIAQLHTGDEYTFEPTTVARRRMTDAVDAGADLVIAHHPHVAQGFEFDRGSLIAHSLGNFVFDQERLETMLGLTAQLDYVGSVFQRGSLDGVYLEDFRPRPIVGDQADTFMRRLNEFSKGDALVFPYNGHGWLQADQQGTVRRDYQLRKTVQIGAGGWSVVDLRGLLDEASVELPAEASLISFSANQNITVKLGRDIMERHGEFEDWDADDDGVGQVTSLAANGYARRWFWESGVDAKFLCFDRPFRGMAAACSTRSASNSGDTVIAFRNRIRVLRAESNSPVNPNLDLTLFGYSRGDNAGLMRAEVKYYPSREDLRSFLPDDQGTPNAAFLLGSGTFDWRSFAADLTLPPDVPSEYPDPNDPDVSIADFKDYIRTQTARALRVFLDHSPPNSGDGVAAFDEFAVINWEPPIAIESSSGQAPKWPHPLEFLRVEGVAGSQVELALEFSRLIPELVSGVRIEPYVDRLFADDFES